MRNASNILTLKNLDGRGGNIPPPRPIEALEIVEDTAFKSEPPLLRLSALESISIKIYRFNPVNSTNSKPTIGIMYCHKKKMKNNIK